MKFLSGRILFFFIILFSFNLYSQTLNLQSIPSDKIQIGFNYEKPFYTDDFVITNIYELIWNIPVSKTINVIGEIPVIYNSYKVDFIQNLRYGDNDINNIFLGMQINLSDVKKSVLTFGFYLPTSDRSIGSKGIFIDSYNIQRYMQEVISLYSNYSYHSTSTKGVNFGLEAGSSILIPVDDGYSETQLFIHYGGDFGYRISSLLVNFEVTGICLLTINTDRKFIHDIGMGIHWINKIISLKAFYRINLDEDFRRDFNGVLGLGVSFSFN